MENTEVAEFCLPDGGPAGGSTMASRPKAHKTALQKLTGLGKNAPLRASIQSSGTHDQFSTPSPTESLTFLKEFQYLVSPTRLSSDFDDSAPNPSSTPFSKRWPHKDSGLSNLPDRAASAEASETNMIWKRSKAGNRRDWCRLVSFSVATNGGPLIHIEKLVTWVSIATRFEIFKLYKSTSHK